MSANRENKILKEIRRRAFARSDALLQEHECAQATDHTLDALGEVTGLARIELETIVGEVRYAFKPYDKDFFSIKNQIALVCGPLGIGIVFIRLLIGWLV